MPILLGISYTKILISYLVTCEGCDKNAECQNAQCVCKDGYIGNGISCEGYYNNVTYHFIGNVPCKAKLNSYHNISSFFIVQSLNFMFLLYSQICFQW